MARLRRAVWAACGAKQKEGAGVRRSHLGVLLESSVSYALLAFVVGENNTDVESFNHIDKLNISVIQLFQLVFVSFIHAVDMFFTAKHIANVIVSVHCIHTWG